MTAITDPSLDIQDVIIRALRDADIPDLGVRVYDAVPENPTFPYASIGVTQVINENAECLEGAEVYQTIDVWSRSVGQVKNKQIVKRIISLLDDSDLSNDNVTIKSCLLQDVNYLEDPDGLTHHAVVTFHLLTD